MQSNTNTKPSSMKHKRNKDKHNRNSAHGYYDTAYLGRKTNGTDTSTSNQSKGE